MKSTEFYALAEQFAPKSLSDEFCRRYGAYDNSGLLLDSGEEAEKILFSLDLSLAAIERAKREGAGIICTHHPAVYAKLGRLLSSEPASSGGKVAACLKAGISVVSMHLNLDAAPCGIDESLMEGIILSAKSAKKKSDGGENGKIPFGEKAASESEERFRQEAARPENVGIMQPLDGGGYGRAYDVPPVTAEALAAELAGQKQAAAARRTLILETKYGTKTYPLDELLHLYLAEGAQRTDILEHLKEETL